MGKKLFAFLLLDIAGFLFAFRECCSELYEQFHLLKLLKVKKKFEKNSKSGTSYQKHPKTPKKKFSQSKKINLKLKTFRH